MQKAIVLGLAMAVMLSGVARAQAPSAPPPPPPTPYGLAIGIDDAKQVAAAAVAKAKEVSGAPDAVAIVGPGGGLVYFELMDNTSNGAAENAIAEARSAALFRRPTNAFEDALVGGRMAILALRGAVPLTGGVPLVKDGKIVGAIGVAGSTAPQDGQVAVAGAAALK
jgi:glc operon protein GlcG